MIASGTSQSLVGHWIEERAPKSIALNILSVISGSVLLALLARISFVLPMTVVPITGQTFGVALLGLMLGRGRAVGAVSLYLVEGAFGLPVFANPVGALLLGPTFGYLMGMLLASAVIGTLADRGWSRRFSWALGACVLGSLSTFTCGLIGLSFFVPKYALFTSGLWPFLPGDLIKNTAAASIAVTLSTLKLPHYRGDGR